MLIESSCTVYIHKRTGFDRFYIPKCHWQESKASNVLKSGSVNADGITVYIPASAMVFAPNGFLYPSNDIFPGMDILPQNAAKDIIIKGECNFIFDNTSERGASESLKTLRETNDIHTVMSIDRLLYGLPELQHIKISAR